MKEQKTVKGHRLRNDLILIVAILAVSAVGLLYLFVFRESGDTVKVTVDGKLYGTYSLSDDVSQDIRTGDDGSQLNRFVISGGKVHMEYATCPDGICVSHHAIFRNGESIVCLPNRVVITVITDDVENAPDIVA